MCEATVYIQRGGKREKVMADVIHIESAGTDVIVSRLFEAPQTIRGVIREVDLLQHGVILAVQSPEQ